MTSKWTEVCLLSRPSNKVIGGDGMIRMFAMFNLNINSRLQCIVIGQEMRRDMQLEEYAP